MRSAPRQAPHLGRVAVTSQGTRAAHHPPAPSFPHQECQSPLPWNGAGRSWWPLLQAPGKGEVAGPGTPSPASCAPRCAVGLRSAPAAFGSHWTGSCCQRPLHTAMGMWVQLAGTVQEREQLSPHAICPRKQQPFCPPNRSPVPRGFIQNWASVEEWAVASAHEGAALCLRAEGVQGTGRWHLLGPGARAGLRAGCQSKSGVRATQSCERQRGGARGGSAQCWHGTVMARDPAQSMPGTGNPFPFL